MKKGNEMNRKKRVVIYLGIIFVLIPVTIGLLRIHWQETRQIKEIVAIKKRNEDYFINTYLANKDTSPSYEKRTEADPQVDNKAEVELKKLSFTAEQINHLTAVGYTTSDILKEWNSLETDNDRKFYKCLATGGEDDFLAAFSLNPTTLSNSLINAILNYLQRQMIYGEPATSENILNFLNGLIGYDEKQKMEQGLSVTHSNSRVENYLDKFSKQTRKKVELLAQVLTSEGEDVELIAVYNKLRGLANLWSLLAKVNPVTSSTEYYYGIRLPVNTFGKLSDLYFSANSDGYADRVSFSMRECKVYVGMGGIVEGQLNEYEATCLTDWKHYMMKEGEEVRSDLHQGQSQPLKQGWNKFLLFIYNKINFVTSWKKLNADEFLLKQKKVYFIGDVGGFLIRKNHDIDYLKFVLFEDMTYQQQERLADFIMNGYQTFFATLEMDDKNKLVMALTEIMETEDSEEPGNSGTARFILEGGNPYSEEIILSHLDNVIYEAALVAFEDDVNKADLIVNASKGFYMEKNYHKVKNDVNGL